MKSKEDIIAHLGDEYDRYLGAIVPPIFQNSLFTRKTVNHGYTYTRVANPTTEIAEMKIAALEGGEAARCFSSGMAAITAALAHYLEKDSHVICPRAVYTPTKGFLETYMKKFGCEVTLVSGDSVEEFEQAIRPNTKVIYLESPLSNIFTLQDLEAISALANSRGIATIIDNTWATPLYQNPLEYGIDLVVHSASKYLGGHSDILGGVVVGSKETLEAITHNERSMFGAVMDPHQSWLLIRSLRTLPVRMKQHQENGLKVASFLEQHPLVSAVCHPGLTSHPQYELGRKQMTGYSGLLSFVPKGDKQQIMKMMKSLRYFEEGPSWGGFESLINSPGLWVNEETSVLAGIPVGLLRISVGLESADSIIDDLDRALNEMTR
ncbi:cystathionine beta-lyase/cystathionine gamma-synthase [Paenibacillus contaminans]|uniref:homocysteine desulfhydrase n=2 Tax=Paenibacillus contaminans TaxID=450362 RepID=A0A329LUN6_9BACL|nr:cystathionine beta-lyase/cystathionine gamma-synthase [Paenibacillus contaminans]